MNALVSPLPPLILASTSPRRQMLLAHLGVPFEVAAPDIDEVLDPEMSLQTAVAALAERKARAITDGVDRALVIGADTIVALDGIVLGKPLDPMDAIRMLCLLQGRAHEVITGVAMLDTTTGRVERHSTCTTVWFRDLADAEIAAYVATGEPLDKAGAYAVQGIGGDLIDAVVGCYNNVVGLPLCALTTLLGRFGIVVNTHPVCRLPNGAPCPVTGAGG